MTDFFHPLKPITSANLFVTGGAGTLGRAIARKRQQAGWTGKLTVYSTSPWKHAELKRDYPDILFVQGDIRNLETLRLAMAGHDIVIHAAAVKYIPDAEYYSMDTIDVNVTGSQIVCQAAHEVGIEQCLGISTDKACHPANTYGASKYLMEKIFQEYARMKTATQYKLVRYGNVLESVGSVIESWKKALAANQTPKMTDPNMTRFWLSPARAAEHVVAALDIPNGRIFIPMEKALSIGELFDYTIGKSHLIEIERIPMRPGEKLHETLLTSEETDYAEIFSHADPPHHLLHPSTDLRMKYPVFPYVSNLVPQLTKDELEALLHE